MDRAVPNDVEFEFEDLPDVSARHTFDLAGSRMEMLMRRLLDEAINPGFAREVVLDSASSLLMVEIARILRRYDGEIDRHHGGLAPWQISRIRERVNTLGDGLPRVSDLAALCGISETHLRRGFKASTGQTVHEYAAAVTAELAADLLASSDETVAEIARKIGFSCVSGFAVAFKRHFGVSPGRYRTRARGDAMSPVGSGAG